MTDVFGQPYADQYDALYGEKNYAAECDAVEELFRRHATGPVHTLLDLGCGTGTHAQLLAQRGYAVTGVDRAPAMLELARRKAAGGSARPGVTPPTFVEGDIRTTQLGRTFDAVLMMFAVLGYQTSDADVAAAMRTVAGHLRPGGLFVCDVWFGPAVLAIGTSDRVKVIDGPEGQLHRTSSGEIDREHHTCRVDFRTWRVVQDRIVDESAESHTMRYFFGPELAMFFGDAGLRLCAAYPFDNLEARPGPASWNVWICGRARGAP
ncbi:MAG: class I SAM-dependent DNA methyltransferase [Gemmatimonadaceae bacterium]